MNNRVLLPKSTTLVQKMAAARQEENRLQVRLYAAAPYDLHTETVRLLEVPEKARCQSWSGWGRSNAGVRQGGWSWPWTAPAKQGRRGRRETGPSRAHLTKQASRSLSRTNLGSSDYVDAVRASLRPLWLRVLSNTVRWVKIPRGVVR